MSTEQHTGIISEDHGQLSQGVEQTVPSIAHDLCNIGVKLQGVTYV